MVFFEHTKPFNQVLVIWSLFGVILAENFQQFMNTPSTAPERLATSNFYWLKILEIPKITTSRVKKEEYPEHRDLECQMAVNQGLLDIKNVSWVCTKRSYVYKKHIWNNTVPKTWPQTMVRTFYYTALDTFQSHLMVLA